MTDQKGTSWYQSWSHTSWQHEEKIPHCWSDFTSYQRINV